MGPNLHVAGSIFSERVILLSHPGFTHECFESGTDHVGAETKTIPSEMD
jgi:hypothetical protein